MEFDQKPDPLDSLLSTWAVEQAPMDVRAGVWQRIAAAESPKQGIWHTTVARFESYLLRPAVAFSLLALFTAAGLGAGHLRAASEAREVNATLRSDYWRSVDPFQKVSMQQ
jgi:hypothetical protein